MKPVRHGTQSAYRNGCRCDVCRTAWNSSSKFYMKKMRDRRKKGKK
jgi:nitric oxide synthase oxygenase domain/subunit